MPAWEITEDCLVCPLFARKKGLLFQESFIMEKSVLFEAVESRLVSGIGKASTSSLSID
jgi:hypothetical protein